jgi:hypothetical protein
MQTGSRRLDSIPSPCTPVPLDSTPQPFPKIDNRFVVQKFPGQTDIGQRVVYVARTRWSIGWAATVSSQFS